MFLHLILIVCATTVYIESLPSSSSKIYSSLHKDNVHKIEHLKDPEYRVKRQLDRAWWNSGSISQSISQMTRQIRDGLQYGWRLSAQIISLYNGIRGIVQLLSPNSSQLKETQDIVDQLRNSTRESVYEYLKMIGLS